VSEDVSEESEAKMAQALKELTITVVAQQEITRQHISNTVGSLAHETEMNKGLLYEIRHSVAKLIITITEFVRKLH
jgi:hypothetical protein